MESHARIETHEQPSQKMLDSAGILRLGCLRYQLINFACKAGIARVNAFLGPGRENRILRSSEGGTGSPQGVAEVCVVVTKKKSCWALACLVTGCVCVSCYQKCK